MKQTFLAALTLIFAAALARAQNSHDDVHSSAITRPAISSGSRDGRIADAQLAQRPATQSKPTRLPDIVFILMDNLGYGEVGVYGGGIIRGAIT
jgi:hypothetical protein